jgi:hypothetical protein
MKTFLPVAVLFVFTCGGFTQEVIRDFPLPTIEALGRKLYRQDFLAARAFDLVFEKHPDAQKLPLGGWVTESNATSERVFILERNGPLTHLAYVVDFPKEGSPVVTERRGEELPEFVATRLAARRAAVEAIPKFLAEKYNFEVLDDPDGSGFLVYGLAATTKPDEVVVGGHYRVSVSADGTQAEQVDALSRSLLVLPKNNPDAPAGSQVVGQTMSHIVSPTPVETHVFASLMHGLPFYVITSETDLWKVSEGRIEKLNRPIK